MSARVAPPLAWAVWALSVALSGLGLLLLLLNGNPDHLLDESLGVDVAVGLTFPAVGAIIASRRPGNAVGWLFCAVGLFGGAAVFFSEYGIYALTTNPGSLPAGVAAAWLGTWIWVPSVALAATFLLLLFPHGRLLSPRWRPVAWVAAGATIVGAGIVAVVPWEVLDPGVPAENPFGVRALYPVLPALGISALAFLLASAMLSVLSLFLRFRRSRGEERQQLKWFVYAGVLTVATYLPIPVGEVSALQILFIPLLPVAAAIAIFKHRLYEIDRIINRTLVYGVLTVTLALSYLGGVVVLQTLFRALTGQGSQLAIVASTLAIAALFDPLRSRVQAFVDRLFYRRKYDAAKTLEVFSTRLRDETDLDRLGEEMVSVVRSTMQPARLSLWLRDPEEMRGGER